MLPSISICVSEDSLLKTLSAELQIHGFRIEAHLSASAAMRALPGDTPRVWVLDIALPDADGRDVCRALRAAGIDSPVLFLSCVGTLAERLSSFYAGGDDYLSKPFANAELRARVAALGRRRTSNHLTPGPPFPAFDPVELSVSLAGRTAVLTPREYRLLAALATNRGEHVGRSDLIAVTETDTGSIGADELDTYVDRLRWKLVDIGAGETIDAVARDGYRLH
ncbi:response regulator transcription factor [Solirubrobacter ginsenosidimutans]|uniref:Response regulator transcription factor n=1 Tax=Solirubrobacter ginsenosidimutans TaxID=490573 RepID=A0A9X3RYP9_9ACTN|nr:response regulator transcription factor [Solirubrobacter ginsenosidimutans]MDA0159930.1 response regulator transcription factor [Solirubrobacter ginsenosidimutans]